MFRTVITPIHGAEGPTASRLRIGHPILSTLSGAFFLHDVGIVILSKPFKLEEE